jgi:DNA-binding transcriptional MerR regulator
VKPYVLRYWEGEFPFLRPGKTHARHRLYRRKDVETLLEIRRLLHTERYTIEGAKRRLREAGRGTPPPEPPTLAGVREELLALYRMLDEAPTPAVPTLRLK